MAVAPLRWLLQLPPALHRAPRRALPRGPHPAEPLPLLRDVAPGEKQALFVRKLHICAFSFDFTDPTAHVREKEVKRQTLLELVDYVNSGSGKFNEQVGAAAGRHSPEAASVASVPGLRNTLSPAGLPGRPGGASAATASRLRCRAGSAHREAPGSVCRALHLPGRAAPAAPELRIAPP